MKKHAASWFVAALVIFLFAQTAQACPGCKEALFDPGQLAEKITTAKGYAFSIGVLLMVPFILTTVLTLLIARSIRKSKQPSA